jgi:TetR/AcrR family transcriptional regulator, transcriptional repressor for nem operon
VRGETAELVLDVAQSLAQTRGFNGFSFRDLAAAIGVKSASIHYHFPSKTDLGVALVQRYRGRFEASLREAEMRSASAAARLKAFVEIFRASLEEDRLCLCGMLGAERDSLPPEVAAEVRGFFTFCEDWLATQMKQGRQDGNLDFSGSPQVTALQLLALLEGGLVVSRSLGDPARFDKATACFLRGLRPAS